MAKIALDDGRSVEMRVPAYVSEKARIVEWEKRQEDTGALDLFLALADILRPAVLSTSWGGDVADTNELQMVHLIRDWMLATEDEVVGPPESGTP